MSRTLLSAAMVLVAMSSLACGDKGDDTGGSGAVDASWTTVYDEVLQPSCTYSTCHEGTGSAGLGWDDADSAYAALVGVESEQAPGVMRVAAGDSENSYLVWKLEGRAEITGDPMPPGAALDAERMAQVMGWIEAGANQD